MKKYCLFIVISVLSLTIISHAQETVRTFHGNFWYNNYIEFDYDEAIAEDTISYINRATETTSERVDINFRRYNESTGWFDSGGILSIGLTSTYPTDYQELEVLAVLDLDKTQEELADGYLQWHNTTGKPLPNADQDLYMITNDFEGIRFITLDGVTGDEVYVFEAITIDHTYLLSLVMPLSKVEASKDDAKKLLDELVYSINITNPEASFLTEDTNSTIDFDGIQFQYDPSIAYRIQVDATEAITGEEAEFNMFGESPPWQTFTLIAETQRNRIWGDPEIHTLPVDEFPQEGGSFGYELVQLQELLTNQPDLTTYELMLPTLPPATASQIIVTHATYVETDTLQGIRYITHLAQEAYPLSNSDLIYMFIGLTHDGESVVSARFPLFVQSLPSQEAFIDLNYTTFLQNYETYMDEIVIEISQLSPDGFAPSLEIIDNIITSIQVNK